MLGVCHPMSMQSSASLSEPISLAVAHWLTIPVHKIQSFCASVELEVNVRLLPKNAQTLSSFKSQLKKTTSILMCSIGSAVSKSESITAFQVCVCVFGVWRGLGIVDV